MCAGIPLENVEETSGAERCPRVQAFWPTQYKVGTISSATKSGYLKPLSG